MATPLRKITDITCEADRRWALTEVERLRDAPPNSEDANERDVLLQMVARYEGKAKPMGSVG
jgi:antitoxin component HigA of HigAB toxin-antitoxin module